MNRSTLTTAPEAPVAAAERLAPELAARAREGEQLGTMPVDLVDRIRAAGLFRIAQPRALGGLEVAPTELIEVVEGLSKADGSAGWTTLIGIGANSFAGWLDPSVAVDLFGADAEVSVATVFAPTGRAVPNGSDRFTVSGRWPFASGCRHAEWFLNGAFVFDGNGPRMLPGQGPDWRLAYFPRKDGEIVDNWDVLGL